MFRNLLTQFFKHDRIVTTEAKAREVRRMAEKLITKAKREDLHARRQVLRVVTDKDVVKRLFDVILAKVSDRDQGGYTRIIKIGNRKGDDAPLALLEILEPGSGQTKPKKGHRKKTAKGKAKPKKDKAATKAASSKVKKSVEKKETEPEASLTPAVEEEETPLEESIASDNAPEDADKEDVQEAVEKSATEESLSPSEGEKQEEEGDPEETKDTSEDEKEIS